MMNIKTNFFKNIKLRKIKLPYKRIFVPPFVLIIIIIFPILIFNLIYKERIYPGITVSGISVSKLTPNQAYDKLSSASIPEKIYITNLDQKFEIPLQSIDYSIDFLNTSYDAFNIYRSESFLLDQRNRLLSVQNKKDIPFRIRFDDQKLSENLSVIAGQVAMEPIEPSISVSGSEIVINKGKVGLDVNIEKLKNTIIYNLSYNKNSEISIPTFIIDPTLSEDEESVLKERASNLKNKNLILTFEDNEYEYEDIQIFKLLNVRKRFNEEEINNLISDISSDINRDPQNPVFIFENEKVKEFKPSSDGVQLKEDELFNLIKDSLDKLEREEEKSVFISIPINTIPPEYQTEDANDLGIKELIGRGSSRFYGSIPSRVHNISLASSHFNGVIIPPGETFSFNASLGDVSEYTGYKQAYIIKDGKTVLGDGGGVCQVSTTLFRAVLDTGLPIIERRAHAYRVAYYEQSSPPGLDATVYAPTTDLKFKNDTPAHILIQTQVNTYTATLVFEIYGTNDGRIASTTKPVVTDVVPPPEDLYIDDPNLTQGTIEQIDWKAWGAKVIFDYYVEKDGENIYIKKFYSNYRPWQSVFLRGTAPL